MYCLHLVLDLPAMSHIDSLASLCVINSLRSSLYLTGYEFHLDELMAASSGTFYLINFSIIIIIIDLSSTKAHSGLCLCWQRVACHLYQLLIKDKNEVLSQHYVERSTFGTRGCSP